AYRNISIPLPNHLCSMRDGPREGRTPAGAHAPERHTPVPTLTHHKTPIQTQIQTKPAGTWVSLTRPLPPRRGITPSLAVPGHRGARPLKPPPAQERQERERGAGRTC